ncbi:MAG: hypothetical protein ABIK09_13345 [Pseudomonadota bacterium]
MRRIPMFAAVAAVALLLGAGCAGTSSTPGGDVAPTDTLDTQDTPDTAGEDDADTVTPPVDTVEVVDPDDLPPLPEGPQILMTLRTDPPMVPFPWDWHTEDAPDPDTGLRLKVTGALHSNALIQPVANMFSAYLLHTELLNGFGAIGIVALPLTAAPGALPAVTGAAELIQVRRVSDGADLPFRVEYTEYIEAGEIVRRLLELDPVFPLHEGERYLVLVRKGLTDADGAPLEAPPLAEVILGTRAPYGPTSWRTEMERTRDRTLEALDGLIDAPAPEDLLLALHYTAGTSTKLLFAAADVVMGMDIEVDLDPDGDGQDNITPGPTHPSFSSDPQVGLVVQGAFSSPDFRDGEGIMAGDEDGDPVVHGYQWREFWLLIPSEPAEGPWPFAITQHGLNSWKETQYPWGRTYATLGIASGGFDFMYHAAGKDGGFWFLAVDVPRVVDNFRQSALDMLAFQRAVAGLDLGIDLTRVAYTGHSLGAIMSSLACPLSPTERIGGFVNGGGDFMHLIKTAFEKTGLFDALPGGMWSAFRVLGGHIMSPSDPALYARFLMLEPEGDRGPCPFQLQVSLQDTTVPPRTGYELAVAAGAPLVEPVIEPWDWLTPTPPEGLTWGVLQFDGEHELFNGGNGPEEKARAQGVFFHYVDTFLHGGAPEIVWPEN